MLLIFQVEQGQCILESSASINAPLYMYELSKQVVGYYAIQAHSKTVSIFHTIFNMAAAPSECVHLEVTMCSFSLCTAKLS
jgi:hypothetical protein